MVISTQREKAILHESRTIAVVGHSDQPLRPSYRIGTYLHKLGYEVYPVNPYLKEIDGRKAYPDLKSLPVVPDIVNIFRQSKHLKQHVQEAIEIGAPIVWAQLGVHDDDAIHLAEEAGMEIITNKCIKVSVAFLVT